MATKLQKELNAIRRSQTKRHSYIEDSSIHTASEYWALPEGQRTCKFKYWPFGKWYLIPHAMEMGDMDEWLAGNDGFSLIYKKLSKLYPVQYFLRDGWKRLKIYYWILHRLTNIEDFWRKYVTRTLKPLNQGLIKVIPTRRWIDKEHLIEDFLYACMIDFVEVEKGLEQWDWTERVEERKMIEEIYTFAKSGRKKLYEKISEAYGLSSINRKANKDGGYEEIYAPLIFAESELAAADKKYLGWILENRSVLWT